MRNSISKSCAKLWSFLSFHLLAFFFSSSDSFASFVLFSTFFLPFALCTHILVLYVIWMSDDCMTLAQVYFNWCNRANYSIEFCKYRSNWILRQIHSANRSKTWRFFFVNLLSQLSLSNWTEKEICHEFKTHTSMPSWFGLLTSYFAPVSLVFNSDVIHECHGKKARKRTTTAKTLCFISVCLFLLSASHFMKMKRKKRNRGDVCVCALTFELSE